MSEVKSPTMMQTYTGSKMQTYTGTKIIRAAPLKLGSYNKLRGWDMPADEDPNREGYLVEYTDGGKPNMPGMFAGYVSWSPKDVFEKAYRLSETIEQRVQIERDELYERVTKLEQFLTGSRFPLIAPEQQQLLQSQHRFMSQYLEVLDLRINQFNK